MLPKPMARFTVLTLGVSDMRRSIAFYGALGLRESSAQQARKLPFSIRAPR